MHLRKIYLFNIYILVLIVKINFQPDSEDGNEMVFCDSCNICVHQACYGIDTIPDGSWLCKPCSLGKHVECVLCPNKGGAMKCTRSGRKWAHLSCAIWIPEVSIGKIQNMEPIIQMSNIPVSLFFSKLLNPYFRLVLDNISPRTNY